MNPKPEVWKIAANWKLGGKSPLSLFLNYGCVFLGACHDSGVGRYQDVRENDLFLICEGSRPVAVGRAKEEFVSYTSPQNRISFIPFERDAYGREDTQICRAELILLSEAQQTGFCALDCRKRFCRHGDKEPVCSFFENYLEEKSFNITSRTLPLCAEAEQPCLFQPGTRYHIPIYQRPYSWGELELRRLVENLKQSLSDPDPVFMGTLQLAKPVPLDAQRSRYYYDVIDGQQRLSTFMLLFQLLKGMLGVAEDKQDQTLLTSWVNRGAAQKDLIEFWDVLQEIRPRLLTAPRAGLNLGERFKLNPYLRNFELLHGLLLEHFPEQEKSDVPSPASLRQLLDYLRHKVCFVVIETHAGLTKMLNIFNTINTTGLDLGTEDLFKLQLYEYLTAHGACDSVFDDISAVYQQVVAREREKNILHKHAFGMGAMLSTYQRILVARHGLSVDVYTMGTERFYDWLFESLLHVHRHPMFDKLAFADKPCMSIEDLRALYLSYDFVYNALDEDKQLRIFWSFFWQTRYGSHVWDYLVIAHVFDKSLTQEQLPELAETLFKLVAVPSLCYGKSVYDVTHRLHAMMQELGNGQSALARARAHWEQAATAGLRHEFAQRCQGPLVHKPKWKNLACRLCEYLAQREAGSLSHETLFDTPMDIEHIQSYTDENARDAVWNEWGDELNSLGNLVMLGQSANRSAGNRQKEKAALYQESCFLTARQLAERVSDWRLEAAEERRENLTKALQAYLFPPLA